MKRFELSEKRIEQIKQFAGKTLDAITSPIPIALATVLFLENSPFWINATPALAMGAITTIKSVIRAEQNVRSVGLEKVVSEVPFIADENLPGKNDGLRQKITRIIDHWFGWNNDWGNKLALRRSNRAAGERSRSATPEFRRGARFLYDIGNAVPAALKFALITAATEVIYSPQWIHLPIPKLPF